LWCTLVQSIPIINVAQERLFRPAHAVAPLFSTGLLN